VFVYHLRVEPVREGERETCQRVTRTQRVERARGGPAHPYDVRRRAPRPRSLPDPTTMDAVTRPVALRRTVVVSRIRPAAWPLLFVRARHAWRLLAAAVRGHTLTRTYSRLRCRRWLGPRQVAGGNEAFSSQKF